MGRSLLLLVSGIAIISGIVQVINQDRLTQLPEVTTDYYKAQIARNLSKSLIDNAVERMKGNNNWTGSIEIDDVFDTIALASRSHDGRKKLSLGELNIEQLRAIEEELAEQIENYEDEGIDFPMSLDGTLNSFTQSSQNIPSNSVGTWDEYKVLLVSTSTFEDIQVKTEVLMQRDSFSKYSYMTQSELSATGSTIWFMDADNIYGPIHTNGEFAMSGSPSFYGLVTSPNMWRAHSSNPTSPNFYGGENFNAPLKSEPTTYEINKLKAAAADGGLTFSNQLYVQFYESGGTGYARIWERYPSGSWSSSTDYDLSAINGIISTTGRIDVFGEVKGNVTLHSETLVEIDGDITYHTNPLADSSSTDMLGIVSEGHVLVDANAHNFSGSQDLTIHGSIMALNTSFYVENYNSGGNRGTLNLLGGIIQQNRGPVGTFSGNTVQSGFSKNYQYDNRLKSAIPAAFPRESVFSIVYWKDEVTKISD